MKKKFDLYVVQILRSPNGSFYLKKYGGEDFDCDSAGINPGVLNLCSGDY